MPSSKTEVAGTSSDGGEFTVNSFNGAVAMSFERRGSKTLLTRHQFGGLLRASRPVYGRTVQDGPLPSDGANASDVPEVHLIHLGPGIMGGDVYRQCIHVASGAAASIRYQSYTKLLPGALSSQRTTFRLEAGSRLRMGPSVLLPYHGARHAGRTEIEVDDGAEAWIPEVLVMTPIHPAQTVESAQTPQVLRLSTTYRAFRHGEMVLNDAMDLGEESLTSGWVWSGPQVIGSVYVFGGALERLKGVHQGGVTSRETTVRLGLSTTLSGDVVVRILAHRVQDVLFEINRLHGIWTQA